MAWNNFVISMKLSQQEECFFYIILNDDISLFFYTENYREGTQIISIIVIFLLNSRGKQFFFSLFKYLSIYKADFRIQYTTKIKKLVTGA